ncbi:MAG: radical SAM protein [Candidatus Thorarchaeota archaeon]
MVDLVRLSLGTAIEVGLEEGANDPNFTTAFIMTYSKDKCSANCAFCPQAQDSNSSPHMLSRIGWPEYKLDDFIHHLRPGLNFRRACIQCLNYPTVVEDVEEILAAVKTKVKLPVSICIHPVSLEEMKRLQKAGAQKIGIAMDACTPELFEKIKGAGRRGPYQWDNHLEAMQQALEIFGPGNVTTHLVVGLGETEAEATEFIIKMYEMGITVGLFAFTAIRGTALEKISQPALESYRRLQVLRYLVANKLVNREGVSADARGKLELKSDAAWLRETLSSGEAFRVTGCSGCNRPYYNERPRGPMYNYPRPLSEDEVHKALAEAGFVSRDGRV